MDWHEGLDLAKQHLEPEQIATLVGCPTGDLDAYVNRQRDPSPELAQRFEVLGTSIERQDGAGVDGDEIREFWTGDQPAELLKGQRFDDLSGMVDRFAAEKSQRS